MKRSRKKAILHPPSSIPRRVAIIGVGLMGGSLGMALVRSGRWRVVGVGRRAARLAAARRRGGAHEFTTDLAGGVRGASIVVLAVPVGEVVPVARTIRPSLSAGALVMDVGSVKAPIVRALEKIFSSSRGPCFVGAHPMTGSEKTGVEHARPDLYRKATCVLTPGPGVPRQAFRRASSFWKSLGARTIRMRPEEHDDWIALVSHLPHLLADSLVLSAGRRPGHRRRVPLLAAGSFRDATRVAAADPRQWSAIFRMNTGPLNRSVALFQRMLKTLSRRGWSVRDLRRAGRLHGIFMDRKFS